MPTEARDWRVRWLGRERYDRYLGFANGEPGLVGSFVSWDRRVRCELMGVVGDFEIAFRNACHEVMSSYWGGGADWLLDERSPVRRQMTGRAGEINARSREAIDKAVRRAGGVTVPVSKIIPELTFDFWRFLTVSAREKSIWVPALHRAFQPKVNRVDVDRRVGRVYTMRNRIAHHEPVITRPVPAVIDDIMWLCHHIRPELAVEMRARETVLRIWAHPPVVLPSRPGTALTWGEAIDHAAPGA